MHVTWNDPNRQTHFKGAVTLGQDGLLQKTAAQICGENCIVAGTKKTRKRVSAGTKRAGADSIDAGDDSNQGQDG
eukprot:scaffold320132_cov19-Tisochrysis_lutea.AAC.2